MYVLRGGNALLQLGLVNDRTAPVFKALQEWDMLGPEMRYVALFVLASAPLAAQWLHYPSPGVPRKADGSVNMSGPAPRLADGKPDFSGIWMTGDQNIRRGGGLSSPKEPAGPRSAQSADDKPGDPRDITSSRQMANLGVDLPGGLPYQPWLIPIVKKRTDNLAVDDPHIRCFPDNFIRAYG